MNPTAVYAVDGASETGPPRRAVAQLAERLGFTAERAGQAALVVSELASNLAKHADRGELLLRPLRSGEGDAAESGIEVLAIDAGPGIPDVALARGDGYSTTGTLGHGLGAIERQADFFQIYTQPSGTVLVAQIWREQAAPSPRQPRYEIGAAHVSHPGEEVCGDDWDWRMRDDRLALVVADGLGHGLFAHEAARAAVAVFQKAHDHPPARIVEEMHAALRPTRGATVAVLAIDTGRAVVRFCGLGNVAAVLLSPDGARQSLVSQNGTAGHTAARIQEFSYPVPPQATVVMFSDGLASHWDLARYPGLLTRHPSVIAGVLYRDFSRRRDDVTIVVAKPR